MHRRLTLVTRTSCQPMCGVEYFFAFEIPFLSLTLKVVNKNCRTTTYRTSVVLMPKANNIMLSLSPKHFSHTSFSATKKNPLISNIAKQFVDNILDTTKILTLGKQK